jgi:hypothetical protein
MYVMLMLSEWNGEERDMCSSYSMFPFALNHRVVFVCRSYFTFLRGSRMLSSLRLGRWVLAVKGANCTAPIALPRM